MYRIGIKLLLVLLMFTSINDILSQNCLECTGNSATGVNSTAIGFGSQAIGKYSFATGEENRADGDNSFASGFGNTAYGLSSISMGYGSYSDGHHAVSIGRNCYAKGFSYAIGDHAVANGEPSIAIGHYVQSNASNTITLGFADNSFPLINNEQSSLMIGFDSPFPTFFVGPTEYGNQFGRIGIGTIDPQTTLDVNGGILCKGFAMPQSHIEYGWVLTTDASGIATWAPPQSETFWFPTENGDIYRLNSNVGIGMVDPLSRLEVKGQISIGYHVNSLQENNLLVAGRVGIGTEFPDEFVKLDVNGKIKSTELQLLNGQLDGNILQCDNEGNATWVDPSLINDGDWTLLANNLFVESNRFVGIGTSEPTEPLDVVGNMKVSGEIYGGHADAWPPLSIYAGSNSNDGSYLSMSGNGNNTASIKLFAKGTNGRVEFHNHTGQVMSIRGDDDVYIGSPDLESNLVVYGEVKAHILRATAYIPWYDYVFEDDYKLMPLHELEEFVNEHHHLPGMPTEDHVHEDGLDLGVMNALLLKKVEELTLYLIKQQKRIEQLESKLK